MGGCRGVTVAERPLCVAHQKYENKILKGPICVADFRKGYHVEGSILLGAQLISFCREKSLLLLKRLAFIWIL